MLWRTEVQHHIGRRVGQRAAKMARLGVVPQQSEHHCGERAHLWKPSEWSQKQGVGQSIRRPGAPSLALSVFLPWSRYSSPAVGRCRLGNPVCDRSSVWSEKPRNGKGRTEHSVSHMGFMFMKTSFRNLLGMLLGGGSTERFCSSLEPLLNVVGSELRACG